MPAPPNIHIPPGFTVPPNWDIYDADEVNYVPNSFVVTTQPQPPNVPWDEEQTECFIFGAMKRQILETPGFPRYMVQPPVPRYRISESPGRDLGMFAACDLRMGDLILSERALLIASRLGMVQFGDYRKDFTEEQVKQEACVKAEKFLKACVDRMSPERQKAYHALHNSHRHDGSGLLLGVLRTNGFNIEGFRDPGPHVTPEHGTYSAVFDKLSHINHSCISNVTLVWDPPTFSMQLRAIRDISKDEELLTTYAVAMTPAAARQRSLVPYGFQCSCKSCLDPAISDLHRTNSPQAPTGADIQSWILDPTLPDDHLITLCLQAVAMMEAEGLQVMGHLYIPFLNTLVECYVALGDEVRASKYLRRMFKSFLATGSSMAISYVEYWEPHMLRERDTWMRRQVTKDEARKTIILPL